LRHKNGYEPGSWLLLRDAALRRRRHSHAPRLWETHAQKKERDRWAKKENLKIGCSLGGSRVCSLLFPLRYSMDLPALVRFLPSQPSTISVFLHTSPLFLAFFFFFFFWFVRFVPNRHLTLHPSWDPQRARARARARAAGSTQPRALALSPQQAAQTTCEPGHPGDAEERTSEIMIMSMISIERTAKGSTHALAV
jgi:hypothetical protein